MLVRMCDNGTLIPVGGNVNLYFHFGNQYGGSSETKIEWLYDSAIPFLGTQREEYKSGYNKDTLTHMFIAELLLKFFIEVSISHT
jgi:hypothetical protein